MENSRRELIEKDMEEFKERIKALSDSIGALGQSWADSKYQQLYAAICEVASESACVMDAGESCIGYISRFDELAAEEV